MSAHRRILATITFFVIALMGMGSPVASAAPLTAERSAAALSHERALTRADVPWKDVGPGWSAVNVEKDDAVHLLLISPDGENYDIAVIPADNAISKISRNGQYALLNNDNDGAVWNLRTGQPVAARTAQLKTGSNMSFSGLHLIGIDIDDPTKVITTDLTGRTLARSESFGTPLQQVLASTRGGLAVARTNNTDLYVVETLTLRRLKRYTTPPQAMLRRFTDATHFQYTLRQFVRQYVYNEQVYRQSIFSDAPEQLTTGTYPGGTFGGHELGFRDAWETPLGLLATGHIFRPSYDSTLHRIVDGKHAGTLDPPRTMYLTDVSGTTAYGHGNFIPDRTGNAIYAWDFVNGSVKTVAGPGSPFGGTLVKNYPWSYLAMIE